jgi:hypothetical protein
MNKLISVICFAGYIVLSITLGLMIRFAVAVAYYTTVQRRWEMSNIFGKIVTASTESPMGLAVAIVPSIVYMVRKMHFTYLFLNIICIIPGLTSYHISLAKFKNTAAPVF